MTREEFLNLNIGDEVYLTKGKTDKGKLCKVTDIFPIEPELRKLMPNGKVTAQVLNGEFSIGHIDRDGSRTLHYRSWKRRDMTFSELFNKILKKGE